MIEWGNKGNEVRTVKTEVLLSKLQGIAQTGLHYGKDPFDRERYEQLAEITGQLIQNLSDASSAEIYHFQNTDVGYATPKVDIRAVIFDERREKILLVKEKADDKWSIPGGWAYIGYSSKEIAAKDVFEEAGLHVEATEMIALVDKNKHAYPPALEHAYKMFILCRPLSEEVTTGLETSAVAYKTLAEIKQLPLSSARTIFEDIERAFAYVHAEKKPSTYFD